MIKVFVIDDAMSVRNGFRRIFSKVNDMELIGEAENPIDAFEKFKEVGLPDVFILDVEMPKMDGLTFLQKINEQKPIPTIMCSTLMTKGSTAVIDALRIGATDIVEKPKMNLNNFFEEYGDELISKVKAAAMSKMRVNNSVNEHRVIDNKQSVASKAASSEIIAIGASTGGVQTLEEIILNLAPNHRGIVITQHMPAGFTASFAARLNAIAPNSEVYEAQEGDLITNGKILIAPGGIHMEVVRGSRGFEIALKDYPKVNSHKPSVNVLFKSVSKCAKRLATGIILTGMGDDGAAGLKMMKEAGSATYGQNEKTSVVYGMPKTAFEIGAVDRQLSIFEVTKLINSLQ
jgi:two-component system chemotaxis response regulator CheB